MTTMKQYVVDAFTDHVFAGNPAAVCVMDRWLPDDIMQKIAMENNLSETAFTVKENGRYHLRWFTPGGEIDLCGHATLATSYIILNRIEPQLEQVQYDTLSGVLTVRREGSLLRMDFPSFSLTPIEAPEAIIQAIGVMPQEVYMGEDMVCVLENEDQVRSVIPDSGVIKGLDGYCLHITARGSQYDCVTRTFAPKANVTEDPVCGRGHCHVIPLWAGKLGKNDLTACQASRRGGVLHCTYAGERTILRGEAALFSEAQIRF